MQIVLSLFNKTCQLREESMCAFVIWPCELILKKIPEKFPI